jgi:hypothetical protein
MGDILHKVKRDGSSSVFGINCRMHVPAKSEEKHWWESPEENPIRATDSQTKRYDF